jgi:hypothetical protein
VLTQAESVAILRGRVTGLGAGDGAASYRTAQRIVSPTRFWVQSSADLRKHRGDYRPQMQYGRVSLEACADSYRSPVMWHALLATRAAGPVDMYYDEGPHDTGCVSREMIELLACSMGAIRAIVYPVSGLANVIRSSTPSKTAPPWPPTTAGDGQSSTRTASGRRPTSGASRPWPRARNGDPRGQ